MISKLSESTIHTVRKIVSNRAEKLGPLPETRVQPFHSPPPYKPGPCCKRPLHPYLRRGIGIPQPPPQPRTTSFHLAVLSSNPDLKKPVTRNRMNPHHTVTDLPPSKEHIMERLSAVTRELGKYFPTEFQPNVNSGIHTVQPTLPDIETTETEIGTEVSDFSSPFITLNLFAASVRYCIDQRSMVMIDRRTCRAFCGFGSLICQNNYSESKL